MDELLIELGCKEYPFDKEGKLTDEGYVAYDKLLNIISNLNKMGVIKEDVDHCEKLFNEIIRLEL